MITSILSIALAQQIFVPHEFVFTHAQASTVTVAGTFNNWNKTAHPLKRDADGSTWRLTIDVPAGDHQYKFVINDTDWVPDPNGTNRDDGYGNINTFITIKPTSFAQPALLGDGFITDSALIFEPSRKFVAFDKQNNSVRFIFKTRKGDVQQVTASFRGQSAQLKRAASNALFDIHVGSIASNTAGEQLQFRAQDGEKTVDINFKLDEATLNSFAEFGVPAWTKGAVFYQIFPERFANGSKANDPANVQPWDTKPTYSNFLGGDLAGVHKNVPYLTDLGITGIYFNPIFKSPANHGYETTDFKLIDPRFGTNEEFAQLTRELKAKGIATVLDGVFNHTSTDFAAFKEIVQKNEQAKTLNWYTIKSFPVVRKQNPPYEAWAGFESMPKLNVMNPEVRDYVFSVLDFWNQNAEVAGWRLDVANEVPEPFWREFRSHLKTINPEAWIIGENWTDSSQWLKGDQWDSAMNYPFRGAVLDHIALGKTTATAFSDALMASYLMYSPQVSANMLNSISTHDVPRFKTLAGNDSMLANMGLVALFSWPGVPCLYYGEELGMEGGVDPDNRRGMRWDLANERNTTLALTKRLIVARRASAALHSGVPVVLTTDDKKQISAFARVADADVAIVAFNRSAQTQTIDLSFGDLEQKLPKSLVDVVSGKALRFSGDARLRLQIPAKSAILAIDPECIEPNTAQRNPNPMVIQK